MTLMFTNILNTKSGKGYFLDELDLFISTWEGWWK